MANRFLSNIRINDAYTFPASDGTNGQVISTDGSGNLSFVSVESQAGSTVIYQDNFSGDGSTVDFTLSNSVSDEVITQVYIDGVYQNKDTYSVSNTTLTFSTAPSLNSDVEVITFNTATTADDLQAGVVIIPVKNTHTASIAKGEPVYITGNVGASSRLQIAPADASNSAKMPAAGLLLQTLAVNEEGYAVTGGYLRNITTDTIDGTSTSSNDTVYVKSGGGLTMTKPTGSNLIQNIAKVARSASGNAGSLIVSSILRTNDVPNLTTGKIWVGSTNTVESTVIHLDETNNRLGINNTTPAYSLDVTGTANITGNITTSGTVDGVDIAAFKTDYDSHTHTESEITDFGNYLTNVTHDTVNTKLVVTKRDGTTTDLSLSQYIDDTNLARLTSGTLNSTTGIATFTRDDATTFTVDFSGLLEADTLASVTARGATTTNTIQAGGLKTDLVQSASQASESFIDLDDDNFVNGATNVLNISSKSHMVFVTDTNSNGTDENFGFYTQGSTDQNATKLFEVKQDGNIDVTSGAVQVGGTTVIDSSRNITGVSGTFTDTVSIAKNGIGLDVENSLAQGADTGIRIRGARNGQEYSSDSLTSYILFSNYDNNTTPNSYDLAKIGAGMYDAADDTGYFQIQVNDGTSLVKALDIKKDKNAVFYGDISSGRGTFTHDTFGEGIVSHRNHSGNAASITFRNNTGQAGILYATYADTTLRWRDGVTSNGYEIWHEGNDGSGSGLDADTLDGLQASQFLRSDTSDTAGGDLNMGGYKITNLFGIVLNNEELTDLTSDGQIAFDLNDTDAPASLGTYGGTSPDGLYFRGSSTNYQVYHTGHFSGTHISNWQTAYGWGDHASAGYITSLSGAREDNGSELASTTDLNTLIDNGLYGQNSNSQATTANNYPTTFAGILETLNDPGNGYHTSQMYFKYNGNHDIFHRYRYDTTGGNGGWSDWAQIWTSRTDGSGSGLDADTVDGLQASQFLRSDTSDTMSGTLTINGYAYINPSSTVALLLGRVSGTPTIQADTDDGGHLMMDSNGGVVGLNWYNTNNVVLAQGGGSVGIGSSTVSHKLDVHGNIGLSEYLYHRDDTNTYLRLRADDLQLVGGGRNIIRLDEGTDPDKIQLGDSATYTYTDGVLTVGHAAPSGGDYTTVVPKLHVRGADTSGSYTTVARFQAGNDADNTGVAVLFNHSNDRGLVIKAGRKDSDREVAYFDLVSSGGATNNMLTMGKYGNDYRVGIKTSSPTQDFHVAGIGEFAGAVRITESGTAQNLLIGNQDSGGVNKPAMVQGVNGYIRIGYGNSWSGEGGTFTPQLTFANGTATFNSTNVYAPIFYDSDNTAYYLNAASTSRLNQTTTNYVNVAANAAYAVRFWNGSHNYSIRMSQSSNTTYGGRVSGETTSDYNMYFTMAGGTNRGFVFRNSNASTGCVAGIDALGNARFIGSVRTPFIDVDKTSANGPGMDLTFSGSNSTGILIRNNTAVTAQAISFYYSSLPQGPRGSITVSSTSTAYNTSSDYRLKENVIPMIGSLERVDQLKPARFNFIGDDKTVDGFLAHEAAEVVPEAVTGTKDEVDSEGNPIYQGIDQAKLVPLLVGAIQELKAEVEALKQKLNGTN